jgi:hypothetical protein
MKAHEKKKAWRLMCKRKALAGMINTSEGHWRPANSSGSEQMYLAGNRGGNR